MTPTVKGGAVLDSVVLFVLQVHLWTGRRTLKESDLDLGADGKLPPAFAATLGAKKVFDPDRLKPFEAVKKRMETILNRVGVGFLNGWVVPKSLEKKLCGDLDAIVSQAQAELAVFFQEYEAAVADWMKEIENSDPAFAQKVAAAVPSVDVVKRRYAFGYRNFAVRVSDADGGRVEQDVNTLGNEVLRDLAASASAWFQRNLANRDTDKLRATVRDTLTGWANKLSGLAFLDGSIAKVEEMIRGLVGRLPATTIEGADYQEVRAMVLSLMAPETAVAYASRRVRLGGVAGLFSDDENEPVEAGEDVALPTDSIAGPAGFSPQDDVDADTLFAGIFDSEPEAVRAAGETPAEQASVSDRETVEAATVANNAADGDDTPDAAAVETVAGEVAAEDPEMIEEEVEAFSPIVGPADADRFDSPPGLGEEVIAFAIRKAPRTARTVFAQQDFSFL